LRINSAFRSLCSTCPDIAKRATPKHSEKQFPSRTAYTNVGAEWSTIEGRVGLTKCELLLPRQRDSLLVHRRWWVFSMPGGGIAPALNKRDLEAEALTEEHLRTHFPEHPPCRFCRESKMCKTHCRPCSHDDDPTEFGNQVSADTLFTKTQEFPLKRWREMSTCLLCYWS